MKKMLVTTLLFSFLALVSFAQERREMKPKRHHPDAGMAQKLNLSGEQKAAAKQQREAFKKQMQDLKNNESITVKEFRDQREVLLRSNKAKMQHLLTDGQKAILEKQRAEVQAKREGMHTEKLKKLQEKIGLSNEQFEQLKAQHEATIKERKEIMENQSLSRIERKEKMKQLHMAMKEQRTKIFTADQMKKMEELKKQHGEHMRQHGERMKQHEEHLKKQEGQLKPVEPKKGLDI